ncbi:MAG: oligopeptide/dipeptide ABC transporter ATP-binding protein, partial [Caldilineaceae bacterium]
MGLIAQFADRVGVMYAGKLVELSPVHQIVNKPMHPYADLLLQSVPSLEAKSERLVSIPGMPPRLINLPTGCSFAPRCPAAMPHCTTIEPALEPTVDGRFVACHLFSNTSTTIPTGNPAGNPAAEVDA